MALAGNKKKAVSEAVEAVLEVMQATSQFQLERVETILGVLYDTGFGHGMR